MSTDAEWEAYLMGIHTNEKYNNEISVISKTPTAIMPVCDDLYISTKTKVLYLNQEIDIHKIFWLIPIIEYWRPKEGVIKKQMKIVSKTKEEYEEYMAKIANIYYYKDHVIKHIDNPTARSNQI
jgi:hypothetical protein